MKLRARLGKESHKQGVASPGSVRVREHIAHHAAATASRARLPHRRGGKAGHGRGKWDEGAPRRSRGEVVRPPHLVEKAVQDGHSAVIHDAPDRQVAIADVADGQAHQAERRVAGACASRAKVFEIGLAVSGRETTPGRPGSPVLSVKVHGGDGAQVGPESEVDVGGPQYPSSVGAPNTFRLPPAGPLGATGCPVLTYCRGADGAAPARDFLRLHPHRTLTVLRLRPRSAARRRQRPMSGSRCTPRRRRTERCGARRAPERLR